jgi:hypothetical protein
MESAVRRYFMRRLQPKPLQDCDCGYNPSRCQIVVVSPAWFMV